MLPSQNVPLCCLKLEPKGAGMTGVSKGIEYPLFHEIIHAVSSN